MSRQRQIIDGIFFWIEKILTWLCNILLIILILAVGVQVFARYILNNPTSWSEILAQYSFVWLTLFGAVLVQKEGGLLYVDTIQNLLKGWYLRICKIICNLVGLVVSVAWCYSGVMQIINAWGIKSWGIVIPISYVYVAVPISFGFLTLLFLIDTLRLIMPEVKGLGEGEQG